MNLLLSSTFQILERIRVRVMLRSICEAGRQTNLQHFCQDCTFNKFSLDLIFGYIWVLQSKTHMKLPSPFSIKNIPLSSPVSCEKDWMISLFIINNADFCSVIFFMLYKNWHPACLEVMKALKLSLGSRPFFFLPLKWVSAWGELITKLSLERVEACLQKILEASILYTI